MQAAIRAFLLLLLAAALPAQARTLDEILSSQKLIVGVNPSVPPTAMFNDRNELDGFDVQFSRKIAAMLGVAVEFVQVGANDRVPFVASGKVDYVMGAMTRTPAPCQGDRLHRSAHHRSQRGADDGGQADQQAWQDLNDAKYTVAEVRGTTSADFVRTNLPSAKLLLLDDHHQSLVTALGAGPGGCLDQRRGAGSASTWPCYPEVKWRTLPTPVRLYYNGLGVAKGNDTLRRWLNVAIFELQSDGTVDAMWKEWFKTDNIFARETEPVLLMRRRPG